MIKRWLLLWMLLGSGWLAAQTQSPIIQSGAGTTFSTTCTFRRSVTAGNTLLASEFWYNSTGAISISDTLGNSWTQLKLDNAGGGGRPGGVIYGTVSGSSGADTVTITVTGSSGFEASVCSEINPLWGITVDVSDSKGFSNSVSSTPNTLTSNNLTTTINGDFIYATAGGNRGATTLSADTTNNMLDLGYTHIGDDAVQAYKLSGTPGTYTSSVVNSNNDLTTLLTVALKPVAGNTPSIISAAALPDGTVTHSYGTYCLQAIGGTAGYTWSTVSGAFQTGLSLSSGGCVSGTPTVGPQNTIGIQVTDGTHTSSTQSATLKVGNSIATAALIQKTTCCNSSTQSFSSNVTSGNLIAVAARDDHGAVPLCTDTRGTVFQVLSYGTARTNGTGVQGGQLIVGTVPSTGADTVSCNGDGNLLNAAEFSNVYLALDNFGITTGATASPVTSNNLTTQVENELLLGLFEGWTGATAPSSTSPFTAFGTNSGGLGSYNFSTSITTYSVGYSYTGLTSGCQCYVMTLAALRPTSSGTAPGASSIHHRIVQ